MIENVGENVLIEADIDFCEDEKNFLTTSQVAGILGMTRRGVLYLVETGKLTSHTKKYGKNRVVYLFDRNEIGKYEEGRKFSSSRFREEEKPLLLLEQNKELESFYLKEYEETKRKNEQLILEMGRFQGLYQGKDEQLRQTQNLLTERSESLIEREAKIKELEAKLEEEKKGTEEVLKSLENNLLKEKEEKEKLKRELLFKDISWWKKMFSSRDQIEKEISKKLSEG